MRELDIPVEKLIWKPRELQKVAVDFLVDNPCAGLLLSPGFGKTAVTLMAIKKLILRGLVKKVLIVAPLRICHLVWPAQIELWAQFHGLTYKVLHGKNKEGDLWSPADIYITTPESLPWLLNTQTQLLKSGRSRILVDHARWETAGFDLLVLDEMHKFKHTNTIRFRSLRQVSASMPRRWGLTGSPAARSLEDIFGQALILDNGEALGRSITHFRTAYYTRGYDGYEYILRNGAAEDIYARISPIMLRVANDETLILPDRVDNVIEVQLKAAAITAYLSVERQFMAEVEGATIIANSAAEKGGKCRQIANGAVYIPRETDPFTGVPIGPRRWIKVHDEKLDALEELIDEMQGEPLLVAYEFNHDKERLQARFPAGIFCENVSMARMKEIEKDWNLGKISVLFTHPQQMGVGLNLQECARAICWFSLPWSYTDYDQLNRRVWRTGNKFPQVIIHHLVAKGTMDEVVKAALLDREANQEKLFSALAKYCKERA